MVYIITFP